MDLVNFQVVRCGVLSVLLHRGVLEAPADQTLHVKQCLGRIDGGLDERQMSPSGWYRDADEMGLTKLEFLMIKQVWNVLDKSFLVRRSQRARGLKQSLGRMCTIIMWYIVISYITHIQCSILHRERNIIRYYMTEGSLEVKLPTIWIDGKAQVGTLREEEKKKKKKKRSEKRKSEKKEDVGARKGRKVAVHCVFSNDLWLRRVEK